MAWKSYYIHIKVYLIIHTDFNSMWLLFYALIQFNFRGGGLRQWLAANLAQSEGPINPLLFHMASSRCVFVLDNYHLLHSWSVFTLTTDVIDSLVLPPWIDAVLY